MHEAEPQGAVVRPDPERVEESVGVEVPAGGHHAVPGEPRGHAGARLLGRHGHRGHPAVGGVRPQDPDAGTVAEEGQQRCEEFALARTHQ